MRRLLIGSAGAQIANSLIGLAFFVLAARSLQLRELGIFTAFWAIATLLGALTRVLTSELPLLRVMGRHGETVRAPRWVPWSLAISVTIALLLSAVGAIELLGFAATAVAWALRDGTRQLHVVRGHRLWLVADFLALGVATAAVVVGRSSFAMGWAMAAALGSIVLLIGRDLWGINRTVAGSPSAGRLMADAMVQSGVGQVIQIVSVPVVGPAGAAVFRSLGVVFAPVGILISGAYSTVLPAVARHPERLGLVLRFGFPAVVALPAIWTAILVVIPSEWSALVGIDRDIISTPALVMFGVATLATGVSALTAVALRIIGAHFAISRVRAVSAVFALALPIVWGSLAGFMGWVAGYTTAMCVGALVWSSVLWAWKGRYNEGAL